MEKIGLQAVFEDSNFQAGIKRYTSGVQQAEQNTEQAAGAINAGTGKFRAFGETIDRSGRQAMIGMRSIGEMARLTGVNENLSQTIYTAAGAADSIGDLSGALAMLNPALLAVTLVGAGAALIFTQMQADAKKAAEEVAKIREPFEETRKEIESLSKLKGVDALAKDLGVTSAALKEYIAQNQGVSDEAYILSRSQEEIAVKTKALDAINKELAGTQAELTALYAKGYDNEALYANGAQALENRLATLKGQAKDLSTELKILNTAQSESSTGIKGFAQQKEIGALQQNLVKAVVDANKKIRDIDTSLGEDRTRIWASAASSIADTQHGLAKTLAGYDRDYAKQVAGFAKDEIRIGQDAAKSISDAYASAAKDAAAAIKDANKESAGVEKDRAKSISRVDFDTSKSLAKVDDSLKDALRNARSARDRRQLRKDAANRKKEILEEAAQRKQDINDQAAERQQQIADRKVERLAEIEDRKKERLAEIEQQRTEALRQLNERRKEAKEESLQRKADAKEAADYQIAQQKKAAAEQVKTAEDRAAKEKQIVRDELNQMAADTNAKIRQLGGTVFGDGLTLGTDVINGLVAGIRAGQSPVTTAIQDVVNAALAAAASPTTKRTNWVNVTGYAEGGWVPRTGPALVHAGEYVLNRQQAMAWAPVLSRPNMTSNNFTFSHTWNGAPASFDRRDVERIAENAAYRGLSRVLPGR